MISIVHTGSAIILSLVFYFVLEGIRGMFQIKIQSYFMVASGILITVIGLIFLFFKLFKKEKDIILSAGNKSFVLFAISAGMIPCPVTIMIMLLSFSQNILFAGIVSVVSISLGMFFLLSLVGVFSIKLRSGILQASTKIMQKSESIVELLEYVSIALILFIGLTMSGKMILAYMQ